MDLTKNSQPDSHQDQTVIVDNSSNNVNHSDSDRCSKSIEDKREESERENGTIELGDGSNKRESIYANATMIAAGE